MEVGHREPRNIRERFPIEWLVDVLTDVLHHILDAVRIVLKDLSIAQHI
jgi:hypothetical protein